MSCRNNPTPPGSGPTAASRPSSAVAACPYSDPKICEMLDFVCPQDRAFLDDLRSRGVQVTTFDRIYFEDPYYDGTQWTTKHFEAGGTTSGTEINMLMDSDASSNAATLYHEGIHTGQPATMAWRDKEYEAYIEEDRWRISRGLPPHDPSFRTRDAAGREVTDTAAIKQFVDREYPGVTSTPASGGTPEQVIGRTAAGKTIVQRSDGTTYERPPQRGDSYSGPQITEPPGGRPIPTDQLRCP